MKGLYKFKAKRHQLAANRHVQFKKRILPLEMALLRMFAESIIKNLDNPSPGTAQALVFVSDMLREVTLVRNTTWREFRDHVELTCYQ